MRTKLVIGGLLAGFLGSRAGHTAYVGDAYVVVTHVGEETKSLCTLIMTTRSSTPKDLPPEVVLAAGVSESEMAEVERVVRAHHGPRVQEGVVYERGSFDVSWRTKTEMGEYRLLPTDACVFFGELAGLKVAKAGRGELGAAITQLRLQLSCQVEAPAPKAAILERAERAARESGLSTKGLISEVLESSELWLVRFSVLSPPLPPQLRFLVKIAKDGKTPPRIVRAP